MGWLDGQVALVTGGGSGRGVMGTIVTVDAGVTLRMPRRSEPTSGGL